MGEGRNLTNMLSRNSRYTAPNPTSFTCSPAGRHTPTGAVLHRWLLLIIRRDAGIPARPQHFRPFP